MYQRTFQQDVGGNNNATVVSAAANTRGVLIHHFEVMDSADDTADRFASIQAPFGKTVGTSRWRERAPSFQRFIEPGVKIDVRSHFGTARIYMRYTLL